MLELKAGADILTEVGGIKSIVEARKIFQDKLDADNLAKLDKIKTSFSLPKGEVDLLVRSGASALRSNSKFRRFMAAYRRTARR